MLFLSNRKNWSMTFMRVANILHTAVEAMKLWLQIYVMADHLFFTKLNRKSMISNLQVFYHKVDSSLLASEKGYHHILVFSLKSEKLKQKITGHRSEVLKLDYCRQNGLIGSISRGSCQIFHEDTMTRIKILKCETSSFLDIQFSPAGKYLFTCFEDSTIFKWDLSDYSYEQASLWGKNLRL